MKRKGYSQLNILIKDETYSAFRNKCQHKNMSMAEATKAFIDIYINEDVDFEKKTIYSTKRRDDD